MAADTELTEGQLCLEAEAGLFTVFGHFRIRGYSRGNEECVALIRGEVAGKRNVLVRIQSSCLFGESFHAMDCDCNWQVTTALNKISKEGHGLFVYLFQEGRGIGIFEKIRAMGIEQSENLDTVEAFARLGLEKSDFRTYEIAAEVIRYEGVRSLRLLTNNPGKLEALRKHGIRAKRLPLELETSYFKKLATDLDLTEDDLRKLVDYLDTKRQKLHHEYVTKSIRRVLDDLERES